MSIERMIVTAAAAVLVAAVCRAGEDAGDARLLAEPADGADWPRKSGDAHGQHFSPLHAIDIRNVGEIGVAWSTELPVAEGIAGTPIVVDGVIYVGAAQSIVFALDARTGRILWTYDPEVHRAFARWPSLSWIARANRGVAVGEGRVFVATADCRLIALDAATGEEAWSRTTCDPELGYSISDSPYYGGGRVFVGNAGSESGKNTRGYVSAYDAYTGERLWRFYTVPSADRAENDTPALRMAAKTWSGDALEKFGGGGNNWNEMTYDPETGLLYFGTAGALPYVYELRSPEGGDALFTSSVLAVDAATGEYVWHYQTVPQDSWDYNATMNIVLADLVLDGEPRKTLLIAPKNGFQYVLDRSTGELLAAGKYARVTWASEINLETGRPVLDPRAEYWRDEPGTKTRVWPNMWGAHSWHPMAFSPQTGLLYIPVIDVPSEVTWHGDGEYTETLVMVTEIEGEPLAPGKLVAWDPVAQRARWTVPHERPLNGGVLATAGGLVFQGNAFGEFAAYDASSGEKLWSIETGTAIGAAPATYLFDGVQYVLLPAGTGGGIEYAYPELHALDRPQGPTRVIAFSLGGERDVVRSKPLRRERPDPPVPEATDEQIAAGRLLYTDHCSGCHGSNAVARYGGSVPDLRYASAETHAAWQAIVVGGSRRHNGMPGMKLTAEESEAIRAWVLSRSRELD